MLTDRISNEVIDNAIVETKENSNNENKTVTVVLCLAMIVVFCDDGKQPFMKCTGHVSSFISLIYFSKLAANI